MSRPTRINPEGFTTRPSEMAWGCVPPAGWVAYPPKIPRRHPLLDTVGRIDDPCARPKFESPDWSPKPSFKPPREGYPNNMCNPDDYNSGSEDQDNPASAVINVSQNTPQSIRVRIPANLTSNSPVGEDGNIEECCQTTRSLEVVKEKSDEIIGPLEEREAGHDTQYTKCMSPCQPLLPAYPCRGVIDDLPEPIPQISPDKRCKAVSLQSGERLENWMDMKPIDGWEFIDKCRTCDYYPIDENLPGRFNNPGWFKGFGCEKLTHPFYVTTAADYGRFGPNPHTMTQMYHPRSSEFTQVLGITGMYRNRTLNTSNNKTIV